MAGVFKSQAFDFESPLLYDEPLEKGVIFH